MKVLSIGLLVSFAVADKAPYPPSGWKPQGQLLLLPQEEYGPPPQQPPQSYGPPPQQPPQSYVPPPQQPPQSYGPPSQQPPQSYGPPPQQPPQSYGPPPSAPPPTEYGPPQNETAPQPEADLDKANEQIMERLKKQEGSETGFYYVYLPDGRLQRVQYTTAPVKAAAQKDQQDSYSTPQDFKQSTGQFGTFAKQQTSYDAPVYPPAAPSPSNQYKQSASFESSQFVKKGNQNADNKPGASREILANNVQNENQAALNKYVASVSYTDVQPITGPIYSYNSQPLVRVLRYAPMFQ